MLRSSLVPDAVSHPPRTGLPGRSRLGATGLILAGALAAVLSGCTTPATADPTGAPTAAPPASLLATPTPTLRPTPSAASSPLPTRPAAMDAVTVDGAIAAVTYFLELVPYSLRTGDVSQLKALSHAECIFCKSISDDAEKMHGLGEHQVGTAMRVLSARGSEVNPGYWFSVDAHVEQQGWQVLDAAGNVVQGDPAIKTFAMNFAMIHQDGRWIVRGSENTRE